MARRTSPEQPTVKQPAGSVVTRPRIPAGYGVPRDKKGLLPWSHVEERMSKAMHYWVCTGTPNGRPYATPVDGLWLEGRLYFGGSPQTRWLRNLAANSAVSVHLESATDVVILRGDAHELKAPERSLTTTLSTASKEKYGYGSKPEDYESGGVYAFRPRVVVAWKHFPKDVTRWEFQDGD